MRYNRTERIGVNATEQIIIKDFDWIFREQPIVDVGVDALIEQAENGDPTGKFIAFQIKTGKSNFSISKNRLTYYISNIHYNYWLNFDIPIILIAHLPEQNETYWIEISESNITKARKRWKIEIPIRNKLNSKAKPFISKLLTKSGYEYRSIKIFKGENIDEQSIYDIAEKSNCIADANESTIKTVELLEELTLKTNESNDRIRELNEIGKTSRSPQVNAAVSTFAKNLNIYSRRLENECQIFSETFGEGIYAFEQAIIIHFLLTRDVSNVKSSIESIERIPSSIDTLLDGIEIMRNGAKGLPNDFSVLREAKKTMLSVIDLMISEYKTAQSIVNNLLLSSNELLKKTANNSYNS